MAGGQGSQQPTAPIWRAGATSFAGQKHISHAMRPRKDQGGKAWEVIVGSGGSPFEAGPGDGTTPVDRYYAWATV